MQRGRSASPSRMRGRSSSPSRMMGRSASGEGLVRGKSSSPSRMRGRSSSPSRMRGRSNSPSRMRGRSNSPSTNVRGRSSSPSRMRGRSNSPSRQVRGRSASPSRMRGRSTSPNGTPRSKSTSPADPRKKKRRGFRRGGKRRTPKEGGGDRRRRFSIKPKSIYKSVRHIAPREECPLSKVCSYFVPIVILLASIVGLIVATGNASRFTPDFIEGLIPTFDNKDVVDPFSQKSDGSPSVGKWDTGGESGLTIEVLNAMSASWEVFFNLATADWEYGNPDALTLKIAKVSEDKDCTPVEGTLVCATDRPKISPSDFAHCFVWCFQLIAQAK